MPRPRCAALVALALLLAPAGARADLLVTRANDTYTVSDQAGESETTTATVAPDVAPGQLYTFTSTRKFSASLPVGCTRSADQLTVTCADGNGADADAGKLVMLGNAGDDTLKVVFAATGSYASTRLEGGDGLDSLIGSPGPDTLIAVADLAADSLQGGGGADTLTCGDAADALSYDDGRTTGVTLSLAAPSPAPDGDVITGPCGSVVGGGGADVLTGTDGTNTLLGRGGDDTIRPGLGTDHSVGGDGTDVLDCNDSARGAGVTVDLGAEKGCDAGEVASTYENVIGSAKDDTITVGAGENQVLGLAGNDTITSSGTTDDTIDGGPGADTITDAGGTDTLAFAQGRSAGVTVSLANLAAGAGDAGDTVAGAFENLTGSPGDDDLTGTAGANRILGGAGDDTVRGGAGEDALDGGDGTDTVRYDDAGRAGGVTVDIGDPASNDGDGAEHALNFENLVGTSFADTLLGTDAANLIDGLAGPDTIAARGGDDDLRIQDAEVDTADCGAGTDTVTRDLVDVLTACEALTPAAPTPSPTPTVSPTATATPPGAAKAVPKLGAGFKARRRYSKVVRLTVEGLPASGATVKVTCQAPKGKRRSCAFATKTVRRSSAGSIPLKGLFKRRRLAPGTKVTIKVTGTEVLARTFTVRIRASKRPKIS